MKTILIKMTKPVLLPFWWQDLLLAIPRIVCGYLLTADFGSAKFGLPWSPADNNLGFFEVAFWFPNDVASYGGVFAVAPALFAWMGAFSEAVGGLFLLFGLQTRIASFLILCTMLVAIFMQQMQNGLWNCLPAMGFLWVSLYTMVLGSGRFGIDYLITKKIAMKKYNFIAFGLLLILLNSCVQKTYKRTIVFLLDVSQVKDIKTVGIRGNDKPLSWENDLEMIPVKQDSLYRVVVSGETGYLFMEVKFTVNHDFELKDQPNRRIEFDLQKDTTYVNLVFNKR